MLSKNIKFITFEKHIFTMKHKMKKYSQSYVLNFKYVWVNNTYTQTLASYTPSEDFWFIYSWFKSKRLPFWDTETQ